MSAAPYFGPRWSGLNFKSDVDTGGPVAVPTPVGDLCVLCKMPVRDGDRGLLIPVAVPPPVPGPGRFRTVFGLFPEHVECRLLLRFGHRYGICLCTREMLGRADALELLDAINDARAARGSGPL